MKVIRRWRAAIGWITGKVLTTNGQSLTLGPVGAQLTLGA